MKSNVSEPLNRSIFHMLVQLLRAIATTSCHQKMFQKERISKRVFLRSSFSELVIQKFKKYLGRNSILVKLYSYILQLYQTMNCFPFMFSKFLITVLEWYIIMVHWTCLKVQQIVWEEWQEYIKRGIPKRRNKIWSRMISL